MAYDSFEEDKYAMEHGVRRKQPRNIRKYISMEDYLDRDIRIQTYSKEFTDLKLNDHIPLEFDVTWFDTSSKIHIAFLNRLSNLTEKQNSNVIQTCKVDSKFNNNLHKNKGIYRDSWTINISQMQCTVSKYTIDQMLFWPFHMKVRIYRDKIVCICERKYNNEPLVHVMHHTPIPEICWTTRCSIIQSKPFYYIN